MVKKPDEWKVDISTLAAIQNLLSTYSEVDTVWHTFITWIHLVLTALWLEMIILLINKENKAYTGYQR